MFSHESFQTFKTHTLENVNPFNFLTPDHHLLSEPCLCDSVFVFPWTGRVLSVKGYTRNNGKEIICPHMALSSSHTRTVRRGLSVSAVFPSIDLRWNIVLARGPVGCSVGIRNGGGVACFFLFINLTNVMPFFRPVPVFRSIIVRPPPHPFEGVAGRRSHHHHSRRRCRQIVSDCTVVLCSTPVQV